MSHIESITPDERDTLLIQAYLDQELDAASVLAFEARLLAEPALAARCDYFSAIKSAVTKLPAAELREPLRTRIIASAAAAALPAANRSFSRRQFAAGLAASALLSAGLTRFLSLPDPAEIEGEAVAANHRRGVLAPSAFDVASSDRHTVKPWLTARLGLSPPVTDLANLGYQLLGGRIDVIGGTPVPALVYRHNEHLITLSAIPFDGRPAAPSSRVIGGLQTVTWAENGFRYWAASDAEAAVVGQFVGNFRAAAAAAG